MLYEANAFNESNTTDELYHTCHHSQGVLRRLTMSRPHLKPLFSDELGAVRCFTLEFSPDNRFFFSFCGWKG